MKSLYLFLLFTIACLLTAFETNPQDDLKASMEKGKETYAIYCMSCHMENGEGLEEVYPPLAKSDYLMADKKRMIQQILYGVSGAMKVNGKNYNGDMTGFDLSDDEVSQLANYIRNSWGNKSTAITPDEVKSLRK